MIAFTASGGQDLLDCIHNTAGFIDILAFTQGLVIHSVMSRLLSMASIRILPKHGLQSFIAWPLSSSRWILFYF